MLALHQAQHVDSRAVVLHFAIISFITSSAMLLFAWGRTTVIVPDQTGAIAMLIGTGVAATLGQLFLTVAFASEAPAKVSVVGLTQVGFAMCYDVGVWGHRLGLLSLLGILLVVAPTAWLIYSERHPLVEE
jgi:drug/metabolite transporter (DMT)-like permease